ncbi:UDP-N-acetylglucosamine diphosphorylase/glucosamine-1-phosphate N-acetyltransferase [bacterium]|nr:MAG: UDP-N-acetylglucosamine diphosphorylase/glucosamine-1-phosphate N-acetyltransferase [bacterium]
MSLPPLAGIVLAAGKGTRMKSDLPKVLHRIAGLPMVEHVCRAMKEAGVQKIVVVIGHGAEKVRDYLGEDYTYAVQDPPQGTGDAVRVALEALGAWDGPVLVSSGDTPLQTGEALKQLADRQRSTGAGCAMATVELADPTGYGRVLFEGERVVGVVEQKDATPEQRALKEVCVSVYAFDGLRLADAIPKLTPNNAQGEYYLTDVPGLVGDSVAEKYEDPSLFVGINDRLQLSEAEAMLRTRLLRKHMIAGVTIIDPANTYVGVDVEIGPDTRLLPGTILEGKTTIGSNCEIGPNTRLTDSKVGDGAKIQYSVILDSEVGPKCKVGPYANLRMSAVLETGVKIGNFVEIKNSRLADGASVAHLSYLGDAIVGAKANVGAGTITCNYDGFKKNKTEIGANAFIGTNSTLVAPVKVGDGAFTAAGSVITKDVPNDSMAFGRARQETREGYAKVWRERKQENK